MKEWGEKFDDCFRWKVGNGKEIRFLDDKWVDNLELIFVVGFGKKEIGVGSWGGEEICLNGRSLR